MTENEARAIIERCRQRALAEIKAQLGDEYGRVANLIKGGPPTLADCIAYIRNNETHAQAN